MDDRQSDSIKLQTRKLQKSSHYKRNARPPYSIAHQFDTWLLIVSLIVFSATGLALIEVLPSDGAKTNLKVLFFATTCGVLSYLGNKISVHRLAELGALGYRAAIAAAVVWFLVFGVMVATLTHTALSSKQIGEIELREAGARIATVGSSATSASLAGQQVRPELDAVKSRIEEFIACEVSRGCLTGKPGRGPAVTVLDGLRVQTDELVRQYRDADRQRQKMGQRIVALSSDFEKIHSDGALPHGEKRAALLGVYFEADRLASELYAVTPSAAIKGLAVELRGVRLPGASGGSVDVASAFGEHASRLDAAASVETAKLRLPPFPPPPSITAGWTRLDQTWPYLFLAIALEGAVIYAFVSVFLQFKALEDDTPLDRRDTKAPDDATAHMAQFPADQPPVANGDARPSGETYLPRPRRT